MKNYSRQCSFGFSISMFDVSKNSAHIVHGWRPSNFARRIIVLLLQANDKSAWRVMFFSPWHVRSANFAWAKRFCYFEAPKSSVDVNFQQISWFFRCTNCMVQTLVSFNLFPQPMNRAEVLHTPSHTYEDRWKITPVNVLLVFQSQCSTFPKIPPTLFTVDDLPISPGAS